MTALRISGLSCGYKGSQEKTLSNLNLSIQDGEIVCLLGQSGCGKTTLLKVVSGLIQPEEGSISLHGKEVSSAKAITPPEERGIGMIFQDYALFPHLTVFENISFGLQDLSTKDKKSRVEEMLVLVNLHELGKRYPHELSGGQQQRVAIARALASKPSLLLLDEPFSNIDSQVRQHLVREIRDILKKQKVAALFVTHSREEGFAFADTIAVMGQGNIVQQGSAFELYHHPVNRFIANFMGTGSSLPASIISENRVATPMGEIESTSPLPAKAGIEVEVYIRPHMLSIQEQQTSNDSRIRIQVLRQQFIGQSIRSELELETETTRYQLISEHNTPVQDGAQIKTQVKPHDLVLFDANGESLRTETIPAQ